MKSITCLGISTAVCCAVWSFLSPEVGLLSWAGFAGCTSYFACPDHGWKGVKSAFFCVMSGIAYALLTLYLNKVFPSFAASLVVALVTVHLMCIQSKIPILAYIPGTFFGSFSTFAAGGDLIIIPCMILGIILGLCCDKGGAWLFKLVGKKEDVEVEKAES